MVATLQGDNVEAAGVVAPLGLLEQEQAGRMHQPFLLAPIDTGEGASEGRVQPVADLTNTTVSASSMTRSSSPPLHRQLRASSRRPCP